MAKKKKNTEQQEIDAMREQLLAVKDQLQQRRRRVFRGLLGLLAAALIALALLSSPLFKAPPSPQELFQQHFKAYAWNPPSSDESASTKSLFQYYELGDYQSAAKAFTAYHQAQPQDSFSFLAEASTSLALGQYDLATQQLQGLLSHAEPSVVEASRWYLALALLGKEEVEAARKQLLLLTSNPRAEYHDQAGQLLSDLEK